MSVTWAELVEVVARATAMYYSHNRMPVMSGNPLDRLHPSLKRECYDGARAALSAIREAGVRLMPEEATEEMIGACYEREMSVRARIGYGEAYAAMLAAGEIKTEGGE